MSKNIFVIGAGRMGSAVAQAFLVSGFEVWINDSVKAAVSSGVLKIRKILTKSYSEAETEQLMRKLHPVTDFEKVFEADIIIETVFESFEQKKEVLFEVDELAKENAILLTNTATISLSELASGLKHQDRFAGMHFNSAKPEYKLIEVIPTVFTKSAVIEEIKEISQKIGKIPIECEESPGFIVNRLIVGMINDACNMIMEGVADAASIDEAMKLALNTDEGPLRLADSIGNDMVLLIIENMHRETGDPRYRPSPYLRKLVRANHLGVKAGKGFFDYE